MKQTLSVWWMHCKSCELIIRQNIEDSNITCSIDHISHRHNTITVDIDTLDDLEKIESIIRKSGYSIWKESIKNPEISLTWWERLFWLGCSLLLLWVLLSTNFSQYIPKYEDLSLWIALIIGLVASVSTCLAVTWGIIIGYSETLEWWNIWLTQLQFHIGRVIAFVLGGAILGGIGGSIEAISSLSMFLNIIIGILLLYIGLQILGIVPSLSKIGLTLPSGLGKHALAIKNPKFASVVGALTFFLPCGFTQSMQIFALQSGSMSQWALMMGAFALGTLPVLMSLGLGTEYIKTHLKKINPLIASFLVVFWIFTLYNGYLLSASKQTTAVIESSQITESTLIEVGHNGYGFVPKIIELQSGKNYTIRVTPTANGLGCFYALSYGWKSYPIVRGKTFDLAVAGSAVSKRIPLVCASMGMKMWELLIK